MTKQEIIIKTIPILKNNPIVLSCALFGSYAMGKEVEKSDIDFLVKMKKGTTLFDEAGLQIELSQALKKNVDIVDPDMLHPSIANNIISERISFYER